MGIGCEHTLVTCLACPCLYTEQKVENPPWPQAQRGARGVQEHVIEGLWVVPLHRRLLALHSIEPVAVYYSRCFNCVRKLC